MPRAKAICQVLVRPSEQCYHHPSHHSQASSGFLKLLAVSRHPLGLALCTLWPRCPRDDVPSQSSTEAPVTVVCVGPAKELLGQREIL